MTEEKRKKHAFLTCLIPYGENNAISRNTLKNRLNCSDRELYKSIQEARLDGCLICSSKTKGGYYQPQNTTEMRQYYEVARKGGVSILATLKSLRQTLKANGVTVK